MGCSKTRKLFSITLEPTVAARKVAQPKAKKGKLKPRTVIQDHCTVCGKSWERNTATVHQCRGPKPIKYQEERQEKCDGCKQNKGGVCQPLKTIAATKFPGEDKPCLVEIGVKNPAWKCPLGKWERCLWKCDKCGSVMFDERGLTKCPICNPKPRNVIEPRELPPLKVEPRSALCVAMVVVGQSTKDLATITAPRVKEFADKWGADFYQITENAFPEYPIANKFQLNRLTPYYERMLFVDADVWITSQCENLFEKFPAGRVWMHSDREALGNHTDWLRHDEKAIARDQGIKATLQCLNTGIVLWDHEHVDLWRPPPKTIRSPSHTYEQSWVEIQLAQLGYPIGLLPTEYNVQSWFRKEFLDLWKPRAKIHHLANLKLKERVAELIELRKLG